MPDRFVILSKKEIDRLMERRKRLVISDKEQMFLNYLGLGDFLGSLEAQHQIYQQAKREGLNKITTVEMHKRNFAVENALVLAMRRSLWGERFDSNDRA